MFWSPLLIHRGLQQPTEVQRVLGVCPQFDRVWEELSVAEHLLFYARLKGVGAEPGCADTAGAERAAVQTTAAKVKLDGDALHQRPRELSGGQKRRLSIAIALVGEPAILFLDEPTTGLDPETRRNIWDILVAEKKAGRTIVITTHSMEEADAVCSRIGIMSKGCLRCLGSQTHLK